MGQARVFPLETRAEVTLETFAAGSRCIAGRADSAAFRSPSGISLDITAAEAGKLAKAFALYFEFTNLAETNHRKRRRRAQQTSSDIPPQHGTFRGTLIRVRDSGIDYEQMMNALNRIRVVPVFTAHPTEVGSRTVLWKRQRIAQLLSDLDRLPLPDDRALSIQNEITTEITTFWQTDEVRRAAPTVLDEIQMGLDYSQVLVETIPELYSEILADIESVYAKAIDPSRISCLVEFGSWIGGDRDGNPSVSNEAVEFAVSRARQKILEHYRQALRQLRRTLSCSRRRAEISRSLEDRLAHYEQTLNSPIVGRLTEPYRRFSSCMLFRLETALSRPDDTRAYTEAEEFAADLAI